MIRRLIATAAVLAAVLPVAVLPVATVVRDTGQIRAETGWGIVVPPR